MITSLCRQLAVRGFESLYKRRRTFRYLRELNRTQWLSDAELNDLQLHALRNLLTYAFANCDFYRSEWRELGLDPIRLQSLENFHAWPIIERAQIRSARNRMRAPGMRLIAKSTGGSTGEPLQFDLSEESNDRRVAAAYRGYSWAGAGPGTKQLHLWGVPLNGQTRSRRLKDALYHRLHGREFLSTFGLGEQRFGEYLSAYERSKPDAIVAYTNSLYEFSRMLDERGVSPTPPKTIVVGAEKLYPFQRDLIERVFGCRVFETYGSREFMLIAAECERHKGMHVTQEQLLVEVLDDDGRPTAVGEEGDVVITDLYNYGMPFVRYRTGDRAVAGWRSCDCGRGLPLLQQVTGRSVDIVTTPDGRRISGVFFPHLAKDFPAIKRFQVLQDVPDRVRMRIVTAGGWNAVEREKMLGIIRQTLGPSVRFDLNEVDDIPLTAAGKMCAVINRCRPNGTLPKVGDSAESAVSSAWNAHECAS